MQKLQLLEERLRQEGFEYQSFFENLQSRLSPQEIMSINVLGHDFFNIVDQIAAQMLVERAEDSRLLGLNMQDFLWELQIFGNQFIRVKCGSVLKLRGYCEDLIRNYEEPAFKQEFSKELHAAFENYFYVSEINPAYLV